MPQTAQKGQPLSNAAAAAAAAATTTTLLPPQTRPRQQQQQQPLGSGMKAPKTADELPEYLRELTRSLNFAAVATTASTSNGTHTGGAATMMQAATSTPARGVQFLSPASQTSAPAPAPSPAPALASTPMFMAPSAAGILARGPAVTQGQSSTSAAAAATPTKRVPQPAASLFPQMLSPSSNAAAAPPMTPRSSSTSSYGR